jgi:hypothetical protein
MVRHLLQKTSRVTQDNIGVYLTKFIVTNTESGNNFNLSSDLSVVSIDFLHCQRRRYTGINSIPCFIISRYRYFFILLFLLRLPVELINIYCSYIRTFCSLLSTELRYLLCRLRVRILFYSYCIFRVSPIYSCSHRVTGIL